MLKKNAGAKRKLITITNSDEEDFEATIADVEKPEWIDLEKIQPGATLKLKKGRRTPIIVNINTNHTFFRKGESEDAEVKITFDDERELKVGVTIQEIIDRVDIFRGVFAMDFGTSNTCYAWKGKGEAMDADAAFKPAESSDQIPTLIFFKDVASCEHPKAVIGNEARHDIKEFGSQTYSYFMSIKRLLGENQKFIVLDQFAGSDSSHRQEWDEEQIASFIVREVLKRAEVQVGGKITQVVATFPILYSQERKGALRSVFSTSLSSMDVEVNEDSVIIDLDETNAAAFNYIYGPMLDEFRRFQSTKKEVMLLSFDFGGGTIDISLIDVVIRLEDNVKIVIETAVKGLTGELYYGGDNVTLETGAILKRRLALKAAEVHKGDAEEAEAGKEETEEDLWGSDDEKEEDVWASSDDEAKEAATETVDEEEEEDPETMDIINLEDEDVFQGALELLNRESEIVQASIERGQSIIATVEAKERDEGNYMGPEQSKRRAREIEEAVETLIPTRFGIYEDEDPMKSDLARKLFMELWHEADTIKIRVSNSQSGEEKVASILKKIAKYTSVDPIRFNEVSLKLDELNAAINGKIEQVVDKAAALYQSTKAAQTGGIVFGDDVDEDHKELKILMAGNSSNLAVVREKLMEKFNLDAGNLIFNRGSLKTSVASGACEEYSLKKDFGDSGLISYRSTGFLDRVPYSIGFYHPEFQRLGFPTGFCPVFPRGTEVGAEVTVTSADNFLIHDKLKELPIFADYLDGASPLALGYFNLTKEGKPLETAAPAETPAPAETSSETPDEEKPKDPFVDDIEPDDEPAPEDDGSYKLNFHLLPDRSLKVDVISKSQTYEMTVTARKVKPEDNPFSGVH
jgi:predicted  nucleic acid-binding Zn-ribbon protein